jgi:hypothetical protein
MRYASNAARPSVGLAALLREAGSPYANAARRAHMGRTGRITEEAARSLTVWPFCSQSADTSGSSGYKARSAWQRRPALQLEAPFLTRSGHSRASRDAPL